MIGINGALVMKVYQNLGIVNNDGLEYGSLGFPFTIETAEVGTVAYGDAHVLKLSLKEVTGSARSCVYQLIGEDVIDFFLVDMEVGGVEELIGREVLGFVSELSPALHGISPKSLFLTRQK